ncbi:MAG: amidohydrolase family protein [Alicyclobacillus sp.]|nr:amidohydrolase family protein [Alicyclobacillus sp.]
MIDIHTHPVQVAELFDRDPELHHAVRDVFGLYVKPQPLETFLLQLDEAGISQAVLLPLDCTVEHGCKVVSNEQIAWLMEQSPRFIGFASVDPRLPSAVSELKRAVSTLGLKGLKLDPALQGFDIADEAHAFPVYEACCELDIPVLMHCGLSWAPKGRAELAQPLHLERVVHAFPELKIIIAHFGWPWVQESFMLAVKHQNVFLDTSILYTGTPAESIRYVLEHQIGLLNLDRTISQQVLFGSNYPRVDPKRVAEGIRRLNLRPALERKIMHENASRLLKLGGTTV